MPRDEPGTPSPATRAAVLPLLRTFSSRKQPDGMHHRLLLCPECDLLYGEAAYDSGEEARFASLTCAALLGTVLDDLSTAGGALDIGAGRTGGALISVCHNRRALANRPLGRRSPIFDVERLHLFCPESLRRPLERAGFAHIRLSAVTNRFPLGYWAPLLPLPGPLRRPVLTALRRSGLGRVPLGLPAGNVAAIAFKN